MAKMYTPNRIPSGERMVNTVFSAALLLYGAFGLAIDDLYIPGKRGHGVHLHGSPAWIMYCAFIFASLNLMSVVIDHYDTRDNEINYKVFARVTQVLGWVFFAAAIALDLYLYCTRR